MTDLLTVGATALELTPPRHERLDGADRLRVAVSGPESNAAIAAARLGCETAWVSKLPDGPLGRRVTAELGAHGVETAVRWSDDGRQGLAFTERAGPPRGNTRIHDRVESAVASATPAELPLSVVGEPAAVFVNGATPVLSPTLAETTDTLIENAGTTTALGFDRRRAFASPRTRETVVSLFSGVDVLLTTEEGAAALGTQGTPTETAHALAAEYGFETVVLTRAERGALVWHERTVHEHSPPETETVDDRGVFDALCGGFLARRIAGDDAGTALAAGVASAALARTVRGPVPAVSREAVERCVASMEG